MASPARRLGSVSPGETVVPADPVQPAPAPVQAAPPAAPAMQLPLDKYDALLKLEAAHALPATHQQALDTIRSRGAVPRLPMFDMSHPLVDATERKYGLPPNTLRGMVGLESHGGNPEDISPTGVYGLMQITKTTGAPYGITAMNRGNPYLNIEAGAHYLRDILDRNGGDFAAALNEYGGAGIGNNPANYAQIVMDNMRKFGPTVPPTTSTTSTTSTTGTAPPTTSTSLPAQAAPTAQASLLPDTTTATGTSAATIRAGKGPTVIQLPPTAQPPRSEPGPMQPTGPSPAKLATLEQQQHDTAGARRLGVLPPGHVSLSGLRGLTEAHLVDYENQLLAKYGGDKVTGKAAGRLIGRTQATPEEARASGSTSPTPPSPTPTGPELPPGAMPPALASQAQDVPSTTSTPTTSTFGQILATRNARAQSAFFDPISDQASFPGILGRGVVGAAAMPSNLLGTAVEKATNSRFAGDSAELALAATQIYRYGLRPATRWLWQRLPPVQRMQAARQAAIDLIEARRTAAQGIQTARTDVQTAQQALTAGRQLPAQITRAGVTAGRRITQQGTPATLEGASRVGTELEADFRRLTQSAGAAQRAWDPRLPRLLDRVAELPEATSRTATRRAVAAASQGRYPRGLQAADVSPFTRAARGRQIAAGDRLSDFQRTLERAREATNPATQLTLVRRLQALAQRGIPELDALDDALAATERATQQTLAHAQGRIPQLQQTLATRQADLGAARVAASTMERAPRVLPREPPTGPVAALGRGIAAHPLASAGGLAAGAGGYAMWAMYRGLKRLAYTAAERER